MKKTWKNTVAFVCVCALAWCVTGCTSDESGTPDTAVTNTNGTVADTASQAGGSTGQKTSADTLNATANEVYQIAVIEKKPDKPDLDRASGGGRAGRCGFRLRSHCTGTEYTGEQ